MYLSRALNRRKRRNMSVENPNDKEAGDSNANDVIDGTENRSDSVNEASRNKKGKLLNSTRSVELRSDVSGGGSLGLLRGLDEDEDEGEGGEEEGEGLSRVGTGTMRSGNRNMRDGGDFYVDGMSDDGSDGSDDDWASDSDIADEDEGEGAGYDSLGEEEVMKEDQEWRGLQEKEKEKIIVDEKAGEDGDGGDDVMDTGEDQGEVRARMLRQALGVTTTMPNAVEGVADLMASSGDRTALGNLPDPKSASINPPDNDNVAPHGYSGVLVLPLFAMMTSEQQRKVFRDPPKGRRLIVIATNVAETSLTIPGVRYVVDCGRQKERVLNLTSGVSKFEVKWVSKASAEQRKGRAGRTGIGEVYSI